MDAFILDVAGLRGEIGVSDCVSGSLALDTFDIAGVACRFNEPAVLEATITNTGDGFLLLGHVRAKAAVACSRCLADIEIEVVAPLDTLFADSNLLTPDEDQDIVELHSDAVDIGPSVEAAVRLELPLAPLCEEGCKGICATCGTDLNTSECGCCDEAAEEGPFSALEGFFDGNAE